MHRALAAFCGVAPHWPGTKSPLSDPPPIADVTSVAPESVPRLAVRAAYDITVPDRELRALLVLPASEQPAAFEALRAGEPRRRAFSAHAVHVRAEIASASTCMDTLRALGFSVVPVASRAATDQSDP